MKFAQPLWLLAGLIACAALVWRYRRFNARQRTELAKFASASLIAQLTASVSPARRQFKRGLVVAGVACVALALARPLVGFRWEEAKRNGLDVMFAVDTSKSMLAQDVKPDRLTRAKMAVEDLLGKMDGDRVGLVAFAGNSFLQCPLTLDYDAFRQSLDALDTKIIPRGGTDLAAAIHETEAALEGNGNNERILVLLTDGEDLEGNALAAARAAAKNGLKIFTVGVGSASGELIPAADEAGRNAVHQGRLRPVREVAPRRNDAQADRRSDGRDVSTARPTGAGSGDDLYAGPGAIHPARTRVADAESWHRTLPMAARARFALPRPRTAHRHPPEQARDEARRALRVPRWLLRGIAWPVRQRPPPSMALLAVGEFRARIGRFGGKGVSKR